MAPKCGYLENNQVLVQLVPLILIEEIIESKAHTHITHPRLVSSVSFEYVTPRIRLTPKDLFGTKGAKSQMLHFICSPSRALDIMSGVRQVDGWLPTIIYEPIPVCYSL